MMNEKERQEAVREEKKGYFAALLPIIVFLVLFIGSGIIAKDFYAMPRSLQMTSILASAQSFFAS